MNNVQSASRHIAKAMEHLREAKHDLRAARSDQHIPLAIQLANLEQIFDLINDPECTPEITSISDHDLVMSIVGGGGENECS